MFPLKVNKRNSGMIGYLNPLLGRKIQTIKGEVHTYSMKLLNIDQKKLKILDVGCGSGWLARELKKYGEVTATDLSSKAIQELENRFSDIEWIAGDFLTIELPEGGYDIVTCLETIAHVPDQKAFAKRISKVTRTGGLLLLTTQNEYVWSRY